MKTFYLEVSCNDQYFCLEDDGNSSLLDIQRRITSRLFNDDTPGSWRTHKAKDPPLLLVASQTIRFFKGTLGLSSIRFEATNTNTVFVELYDSVVKPFSTVQLDETQEDDRPETLRTRYKDFFVDNRWQPFCRNMKVDPNHFRNYLVNARQRYGPKMALDNFHKYSPITKDYLISNEVRDRDTSLGDKYLRNGGRIAKLFKRRILQLMHLFPEINGYGRSVGGLSWINVYVQVSDRMSDIENHLFHDINCGYIRIVTRKDLQYGKMIASSNVATSVLHDTDTPSNSETESTKESVAETATCDYLQI